MRLRNQKLLIAFVSFSLGCSFALFFLSIDQPTPVPHENSQKFSSEISVNRLGYDVFLMILVFSSSKNFDRRQVLRQTWLSDVEYDVKYYFVLNLKGVSEMDRVLIEEEEKTFKDLLIFPNIEDTFHHLTVKLLAALSWISGIKKSGQDLLFSSNPGARTQSKYMLKCDDDSYVRVSNIVNELKSNMAYQNLYWGFFDGRASPKRVGKYKEIDWNICDNYLPYALGGGYVLSDSLINFISMNAGYLKQYQSEDVSVGAWLSVFLNLNRQHDPRFDTEFISRGCHNSYLITHKHSINSLEALHKSLTSTGKLCTVEFRTRLSYIYNWQTPPSKCCIRQNASVP